MIVLIQKSQFLNFGRSTTKKLKMKFNSIILILCLGQYHALARRKCTIRRCNQCATVFEERRGTKQQQTFCRDYIQSRCCRKMILSSVQRHFWSMILFEQFKLNSRMTITFSLRNKSWLLIDRTDQFEPVSSSAPSLYIGLLFVLRWTKS